MYFSGCTGIPLLVKILLLQQQLTLSFGASLQQHKKGQSAVLHNQNTHTQKQQSSVEHHEQPIPNSQYVHEKVNMAINPEEDFSDSYQIVNDVKHESSLSGMPSHFPWQLFNIPPQTLPPIPPPNVPYQAYPFENIASIPSPRFLPLFGVTQPFFIPYPFYVPSEIFYNDVSGSNGEAGDVAMSRAANGRRPVSQNPAYQRNSPIYYVRLPPTPYMFLPNLGLPSPAPSANFVNGYSPYLSYQSMSSISPFSAIYNLPINFISNGKPSNIYQVGGSPNDLQNPLQFGNNNNFGMRPAQSHLYRPSTNNNNYITQPSYSISTSPPPQHDSKLTLLKRPFVFNGRPEDIYILPSNLNSMYSDSNYY